MHSCTFFESSTFTMLKQQLSMFPCFVFVLGFLQSRLFLFAHTHWHLAQVNLNGFCHDKTTTLEPKWLRYTV
jgi:hypothetical protein